MWRASPSRLTLHSAPMVSASGICGLGQCSSNRSTSQPQPHQAIARRALELARREMARPDFRGHEHLVALGARGAKTLADLALVLVDLGGIDVAIAEPQRLLDQARAGSPAQLPGAEPEQRIRAPRASTFGWGAIALTSVLAIHCGACGGLTMREPGRASMAISAISASVSLKSRLPRFSASRSRFDVRGIGMIFSCSRKRSDTCAGDLLWARPMCWSTASAGTLPRASGQ